MDPSKNDPEPPKEQLEQQDENTSEEAQENTPTDTGVAVSDVDEKNITDEEGGDVSANSKPRNFSTFRVSIIQSPKTSDSRQTNLFSGCSGS
jgi:hypothetical protein